MSANVNKRKSGLDEKEMASTLPVVSPNKVYKNRMTIESARSTIDNTSAVKDFKPKRNSNRDAQIHANQTIDFSKGKSRT